MEKEVNFMELRDIINDVSEFYRNENGKIGELCQELRDIEKVLDRDDMDNELLLSEYRRLINRKCDLQDEISRRRAFAEGILETRKLLTNIGFNIKIENNYSKEDMETDSCELMYRMKSDEIFAETMRKEKKNNVV